MPTPAAHYRMAEETLDYLQEFGTDVAQLDHDELTPCQRDMLALTLALTTAKLQAHCTLATIVRDEYDYARSMDGTPPPPRDNVAARGGELF